MYTLSHLLTNLVLYVMGIYVSATTNKQKYMKTNTSMNSVEI